MKKIEGPYIPMSDCECYLMAVELVDQEIERFSALIVNTNKQGEDLYLDTPWSDIYNAMAQGKTVYIHHEGDAYVFYPGYHSISNCVENTDYEPHKFDIYVFSSGYGYQFTTGSSDGYPKAVLD